MTSITATKKGIVDFLWDWAEPNGDWAKLLVSKIVSTEESLSTKERNIVFNYFLQSINMYSGLEQLNLSKPVYSPTDKHIELISLSNIEGVNRLAKNQAINFSKNLTVVFGENGTGKTGYSRILKSLGFSYDNNNKIFSNIFSDEIAKTAKIEYKSNDEVQTPFIWDGTNRNPELGNISVFNSNCVQVTLSDRQLIVSPIGFHFFTLVTSELNELTNLLKIEIKKYPTSVAWIDFLTTETPQKTFITQLSDLSDEKELNKLADFKDVDEKNLKTKQLELSNLNKSLIQTKILNLKKSISELDSFIHEIELAKTKLNLKIYQTLIDLNKQIKDLESKTQKGIQEIASSNGIEFYETEQFQTFISAAEKYIQILNQPEYPKKDDICIYCLQPLQTSAKELLKSYRDLLNDKTQEKLSKVIKQKAELIKQVSEINETLVINQETFGLDNEENPIQPQEIIEYNKYIGFCKTEFIADRITDTSEFNFNYDNVIKFLYETKDILNRELIQKQELVTNLSSKENELKNEIAELNARKLLSTKVEEIKNIIKNHKIIKTLTSQEASFSTYSISKKTTEARNSLIKLDFEQIFQKELKELRKNDIKIDLNFGTDRGNSQVKHRIRFHLLSDILSEGEQKAIALSEFLTELQLDNIKAPVIFDDPVNSLDHNIIDDVAKRLLKLSAERQVVIFTHSILLFYNLLCLSKEQKLDCKFYNSKKEYDQIGIIKESEEEISKETYYHKKINTILNNNNKDRAESEVSAEGYGYLRSAIELFVELEIFQGTVKRYHKNIAFTKFVKVKGSDIDKYKNELNEIFIRCCGYINGHSNPQEIYSSPTILDLKTDFDNFSKIRKIFL
jgi:hypothetical protein